MAVTLNVITSDEFQGSYGKWKFVRTDAFA